MSLASRPTVGDPAGPQAVHSGASVVRSNEPDPTGEPVAVLLPASPVRVTGPGRRERAYLAEIEDLERRVARGEAELAEARREIDAAALVERGTQRLADRLEEDLASARAELAALKGHSRELTDQLAAAEAERDRLAAELRRTTKRPRRSEAPARPAWWRSLLGARA